jgi:hypothetical protein
MCKEQKEVREEIRCHGIIYCPVFLFPLTITHFSLSPTGYIRDIISHRIQEKRTRNKKKHVKAFSIDYI